MEDQQTGEDARESMDFDVVIVGAGPAGLSAAIRTNKRRSAPIQNCRLLCWRKALRLAHIFSRVR